MGTAFFRTENIVEMAQFCAELTRQGIAYHVLPCAGGYNVNLTGY
jgi:hypothetical protein